LINEDIEDDSLLKTSNTLTTLYFVSVFIDSFQFAYLQNIHLSKQILLLDYNHHTTICTIYQFSSLVKKCQFLTLIVKKSSLLLNLNLRTNEQTTNINFDQDL